MKKKQTERWTHRFVCQIYNANIAFKGNNCSNIFRHVHCIWMSNFCAISYKLYSHVYQHA